MKKRIVTVFPQGKNIHLIKDVGMVPYMLQKEGYYDASITFYEAESELPYLNNEVKGLKYKKIKKIFSKDILNILYFLIVNSRTYDIVMFFHLDISKAIVAFIIKVLKFGRVKFYIKLDANNQIYKLGLNRKTFKNRIFGYLMNFVDVLTVETKEINNYLNKQTFIKTKHLPNGFINSSQQSIQKQKTILIVARIGDPIKDHDTLLKALEKVELKDWKVKIVGPIEKEFEKKIELFYHNNSSKKEAIIFTGNISNRIQLEKEYAKSKIFIMTSISEGFPLVLTEALSKGNYIISTELPSAKDITNNGEYGKLFPIEDSKALSSILQNIIDEKIQLPDVRNIVKFAEKNFNWKIIVRKLHNYLENKE
ncbi:hypothetical protein CGC54_06635 [Capnocytophaga canimorsus]|uniref:Glycosyl transferase family 1 domain-containing protein n=1 Tax=Capnocytophaga canimorsus TaxID=28188 RepID=A0A1X7BZ08_9FLAO|nr:glycosyltransferase [Capnocytophaga canimorsus]ATA94027.1 hypothetical protein CGC54_06635 [Capnocytophaga canimorsus]SMD29010.1 conserved hypothetical protein [Capnocytophaga canimorsus]